MPTFISPWLGPFERIIIEFRNMSPRVLVCRPYTYPFLFHWLLSFVPEQFTMSAERLASPLIDTCYVLLTFAFAF